MDIINSIEIETMWGYKSFELYEGDITDIDTDVDLIGISAFAGSYRGTPGTMIHVLKKEGLNPLELLNDCEFDCG